MLYKGSDFPDLPAGTVNYFGFSIGTPAATAASGNIKVYMVNTSDAIYSRGTTWTSIISSPSAMALVYDGPLTIPAASGTFNIMLQTPFNYTGGNFYLAYEWSTTTRSAVSAIYNTNNELPASLVTVTATTLAGTATLTGSSAFRPVLILGYPTPGSDMSVMGVFAMGKMALTSGARSIQARVKNTGTTTLTNRTISLSITGANTFNTSVLVSSLAPGAERTVAFPAFAPTVLGSNNLVEVSVAADDVSGNNSKQVNMVVTPSTQGYAQYPTVANALPVVNTAFEGNYPLTNPTPATRNANFLAAFRATGPTAVTAVNAYVPGPAFSPNINTTGVTVYGVVLNAAGVEVARSANKVLAATDLDKMVNFPITVPPTFSNNEVYYIGMAQPAQALPANAPATIYPMGAQKENSGLYWIQAFYRSAEGSNTAPVDLFDAYKFVLEAEIGTVNFTWTGATSTDWNTASNWSNNSVPTASSDVVIPSGVSRYPVISSGTALAKDLTIASSASLTVNGGTLEVKEDFTNNGAFTATGGSATFSGSVLQVIGGTNPSTFHDLTISAAGASLAGPVSVQRVLTLNGNLNTNGNTFTLLSNATGTAMVVNAGGVVNGTAKVQRYINPALNAAAGYRHFASPVTSTTVSDLVTGGFTPVVNPAYNTATKPGTVRPFPTVFQYNQSRLTNDSAATMDFGFGWESPASLSSALTPGRGYSVNIPASQTVDFTGTLNNGTVTVTGLGRGATAESGWHLLGNPYPAPIDWDNITVPSGMMDAVYAFRSSSAYNGAYAAYVNGVGSLTGGVIPAMQAFFVRTTAPVASFSFTNAARLTSYQNPSFYRTTETRPLLQLSASKGQQQDEAYVYLEQGATSGMDNSFDAFSLPMGAVRVFTLAGTSQLSINGLGYAAAPQQIPLVVEGVAGAYQLKVEQLLNQFQVQLEDNQLNTMQTLTSATVYSFSHAGGSTANRFVLHVGARVSGIAEAVKSMEVKLYPNPSQGKFQLQLSGLKASSAEMTITDLAGKTILQKKVKANGGTISEAVELKAAKGIYLLQIKADQQVITRKIVIE
ncbi:T9SS type A sorting domain-containing protein [Adhaeribacter soli]|uniref:T9SS type A sorting domain-containing protein n=1 Tax=Adhaeribacter soli TaxID=2607655 RepID=A0A5N1ITA0_9BACT|nr:T9SS type A sorting domain-containing protein [Adhaeribacter soli]KAA9331109.1 T9SS type A sorting domain-containing protein [Adhaeribacter soli]